MTTAPEAIDLAAAPAPEPSACKVGDEPTAPAISFSHEESLVKDSKDDAACSVKVTESDVVAACSKQVTTAVTDATTEPNHDTKTGDSKDYKYPVSEKPPFVEDIAANVATQAMPVFEKQGKPRGRKKGTKQSQAIADELGEEVQQTEVDGESGKSKSKRKPAAAKGRATKISPAAKTKAMAKAKAKTKPRTAKKTDTAGKTSSKSSSSKRRATPCEDDESLTKPKKRATSRAIRMSATADNTHVTGASTATSTEPIPADAIKPPAGIHGNNVYSNAYRKALKTNTLEESKKIAGMASALFRKHGLIRPMWQGEFKKKSN